MIINDILEKTDIVGITTIFGNSGSGKTMVLKFIAQYYYKNKECHYFDENTEKILDKIEKLENCVVLIDDYHIYNNISLKHLYTIASKNNLRLFMTANIYAILGGNQYSHISNHISNTIFKCERIGSENYISLIKSRILHVGNYDTINMTKILLSFKRKEIIKKLLG
jgi:ABC-type cobalamin/Fe3+-siderophores transport system ATPase subunit